VINFVTGDGGFIGAQVGAVDSITHLQGLLLGVRMPEISGKGLFLLPHGVLHAASQFPPTTPVSPGSLVVLRGAGFTDQSATADGTWPVELAGVKVTVNGVAAAIGAVAPEHITARIPDDLTGGTATFRVEKADAKSNEVAVELAAASPAVVSEDGTGTGAVRMEAIAPTEQFSFLATGVREGQQIAAYVGGRPAQVLSVSSGPEAGIVRIAVKAPPSLPPGAFIPLAIAAADGFTCLADAPVKVP
jgi:hypothetical protein